MIPSPIPIPAKNGIITPLMMTNSLPLRQTDVKWFQHVGNDHVGVLGVRPRLCRVDVQLEILEAIVRK